MFHVKQPLDKQILYLHLTADILMDEFREGKAMRLNGWQRIGVVLSVIWGMGGAVYQRSADVDRASNSAGFAMKVCEESQDLKHLGYEPCSAEFSKMFALDLEGSWGNVAIVAIGPILIGWMAAYLGLWTVRWVRKGFRA